MTKKEFEDLMASPSVSRKQKEDLASEYFSNIRDGEGGDDATDYGWKDDDELARAENRYAKHDDNIDSDYGLDDDDDLKKYTDGAEKSAGKKLLDKFDDNAQPAKVAVGGFQIADAKAAEGIATALGDLSAALATAVPKDIAGSQIRDKSFGHIEENNVSGRAATALAQCVDDSLKDLEVASGYLDGLSKAFSKAMQHYQEDEDKHVSALKSVERDSK